MDLKPTDEQQAIADALHDFAESEIRPAARECEEAGAVVERIDKQLFEMGVAVPLPEPFGGQGTFDTVTSMIIAEEIAWGDPAVAFQVLYSGAAATLIDIGGTDQQRAELLPRFAEGARGCVALAERDAGSDVSLLDSTATEDGKLSGTKYAVVNAEVGSVRLAVVRMNQEPSLWLIPEEADIVLMPEDKLGLRGAKTFKVTLDQVAAATRIGAAGAEIMPALLRVKLIDAAIAIGLGRASLEYATRYAQERTAFGRPIGAFQAIAFKIADRAMDLETSRLLVWEAAAAVDSGDVNAQSMVMSACGHAVTSAVNIADDGVQILGGHGYMRDHPQELWYRDALTLATLDSSSMVGDVFGARSFRFGGNSEDRGALT
ncbi:MAG: acyl-CoA dehydrogenase family protein [Actinomycetota bacterium]|nr:acyl-CoA dehydrogenase family protein [Actinomycetota bacterium]